MCVWVCACACVAGMKRPPMIMGVWQTTPGVKQSQPPLYHPATFATSVQPLLTHIPSHFHYSHLTGQRIRVTLGGPPPLLPLPPLLKHASVSHPLFPVHWLVYGGWHWASSISSPISHFSLAEGCRFLSVGFPPSRVPVSTPPLFFAAHSFHFLIRHSCFSLFLPSVSRLMPKFL